jgi:MarR family transcriptional regulator, organic hydroperoxide resistance regulator
MSEKTVAFLMEHYPRILQACQRKVVKDGHGASITSHQARILDHLDDEVPRSLNSLASHMGVTPATMSIAVEKLVAKGFLTRERSKDDRRKILLRLTPEGSKLRETQTLLEPERVREMLALLPEAEQEAGVLGIVILARAADQYIAKKGARADREKVLMEAD